MLCFFFPAAVCGMLRGRQASLCRHMETPITPLPFKKLYMRGDSYSVHLPGRGVGLIKKGPRLVWSRVIAL